MAAAAVAATIEKFRDAVAKLDEISGEAEQIEWSKIQRPTDEVVVLYDTLAPAPEDLHVMNAMKALQGDVTITAKPGVKKEIPDGAVLEKDGALFENMVSPPYPKSSARGGGGGGRKGSHLSCASPFSVPRFNWTEEYMVQLFEYYAKDIESSGSICFKSLTQKLRDNGVPCNIKNVKEKIKNEKRIYKTWIDSNQSDVKNNNIMKSQFLKEPKHVNLMRRMFQSLQNQKAEPPAASGQPTKAEEDAIMAKFLRLCNEPAGNIRSPINEVITSTTETTKDPSRRNEDDIQWIRNDGGDGGENEDPVVELRLLVDGIERLCVLTDEIERAGLELVRVEREDVDNISVEIVDQLSSAYTLAVAAAKATPSDNELMRVAVEARLKLAAAIHQPD